MPRTKLPNGSAPVTLRLSRQIRKILTDKAQKEAIGFSELVRRVLRRETARGSTPAMNTKLHLACAWTWGRQYRRETDTCEFKFCLALWGGNWLHFVSPPSSFSPQTY